METLGDKSQAKTGFKFYCEKCDYGTCKKSGYDAHISTDKHKKVTNGYKMGQKQAKNMPIVCQEKFVCSCGKEYQHRQGLWRHKKLCEIEPVIEDSNKQILPPEFTPELIKLITELVKGQNGIQESIVELCKNGTHNTSNSHNNNSNNKSFNLQFFLNETCKNAMNINEFVDSLQLQMSDLENVGESGYIEGISSIIIKKLNTLDVTERPIHCTDKKRETMYIRDENKWEKEDEKKTKMHKMVTRVANKNINMISEFQKLHPEWKKCSSKYADQHNKIVIESMGGKGDNEYEKQEKIIKKIAKEVFVDKCL